jgi:hypothetical protein
MKRETTISLVVGVPVSDESGMFGGADSSPSADF